MVKLDVEALRYMTRDEWRVLTAVEMGMKNHELVPTPLIQRIAGLKKGGGFKVIKQLHKNKLLFHEAKKYDGYRLTYLGYDFLAIKTLLQRGHIAGLGRRIGVGKESDIFSVINDDGEELVLKIHRLGRVSFRAIKTKRDYLGKRKSASWLYMSRLAAMREFAYMKALHEHDFVVPTPIDHNRHCVLMTLVDGKPFANVNKLRRPDVLYSKLMNMIVKFAEHGLIHCDFNEFNLLISAETEDPTVIDFPQMVSTAHPDAKMFFERDVQCVRTFFARRFHFESDEFPTFFEDCDRTVDLDVQLRASGALNEFDDEVIETMSEEDAEEGDQAQPDEEAEPAEPTADEPDEPAADEADEPTADEPVITEEEAERIKQNVRRTRKANSRKAQARRYGKGRNSTKNKTKQKLRDRIKGWD